jgi:glycosyltransferase involved in cell wall biosynthesis
VTTLDYAIVTPARNEADNLPRIADCLRTQSVVPRHWLIVDNGSTDDTVALASELAAEIPWIEVLEIPGEAAAQPGAPVVRAFHAGLERIDDDVDIVVKLDADVSFDPDYFERHVAAFEADDRLGIAGGTCLELREGRWQAVHVTGDHVRGASRAYRRGCLRAVTPLPERVGWDGIDELKAAVLGWKTMLIPGLEFFHHRALGARDGASTSRWVQQGRGAHYMGYRPSYLLMRTIHHARRNPAALAMLAGYVASAIRQEERYGDDAVRDYLRRQQRLRTIRARAREAQGKSPSHSS